MRSTWPNSGQVDPRLLCYNRTGNLSLLLRVRFMFFLILPLAIVLIYVLVTSCIAYRRGKMAFSQKATRAEKTLRHLVTFLTAVSGGLLFFGLNFWNVMSDRGFVVGTAFLGVILILRSIMIELGIRRVNSI